MSKRVVHCFIGSIPWYYTYCGQTINDNTRLTNSVGETTCLKCLKLFQNREALLYKQAATKLAIISERLCQVRIAKEKMNDK